jgi:hypothetical protein
MTAGEIQEIIRSASNEKRASDRVASAITTAALMISGSILIAGGVLAHVLAHGTDLFGYITLGLGAGLFAVGYLMHPPTFR